MMLVTKLFKRKVSWNNKILKIRRPYTPARKFFFYPERLYGLLCVCGQPVYFQFIERIITIPKTSDMFN